MRSNRRRNWFIKRIALGLAIAAVAAPVAQAKVDEGSSVQANGYQAFATDFPSSQVNASDYGMPRALPSDYALASREVVRADPPGQTVSDIGNIGEPQVVRADPPGQTVSDIGNIGEPQVVAAGFEWGDAAIGAGLALLLVALGSGAVLATRHLGRAQTA
jgi:hypothetical protein